MTRAIRAARAVRSEPLATYVFLSDPHYHDDNLEAGDANVRQVAAINGIQGVEFPLGGICGRPTMVFCLGDNTHENFGSIDRWSSDYRPGGDGGVIFPVREIDGNHDPQATRDQIIARYGSLNWSEKIGPVFFQALTEDYRGPNDTDPPTAAQIASVAANLNSRPTNEPLILLVHRSLTGTEAIPPSTPATGYISEWTPEALDALDALLKPRRTVAILCGHNHYTTHSSWRGYKLISPGSVRQSPVGAAFPPYDTIYPESFVVMRFFIDRFEIGSLVFGFDGARKWKPGTWEWYETVRI